MLAEYRVARPECIEGCVVGIRHAFLKQSDAALPKMIRPVAGARCFRGFVGHVENSKRSIGVMTKQTGIGGDQGAACELIEIIWTSGLVPGDLVKIRSFKRVLES